MFDCHYDLLTYIYINKNNIKKVKKYCNKIFTNNISGGIFNLFYMSPAEMLNELNIHKNELNIIENLKIVNNLVNTHSIIPKNIEYIYGIEGLDYLEKIDDIDILYSLGMRSVNIVWNNDNKFGGGAKGNTNRGLTPLGEKLIKKLVNKKIAIDLSHANKKTFYNIVEICQHLKNLGNSPIVFASHSNIQALCNVPRNLSDDQILKIKELNGLIGIVSVKPFCIKENNFDNNKSKYFKSYLQHICYMKNLLGSIDNIAVSTDDMTYYNTKYYRHFNVFKQEKIKEDLTKLLLSENFSKYDINKILYSNFLEKILKKVL